MDFDVRVEDRAQVVGQGVGAEESRRRVHHHTVDLADGGKEPNLKEMLMAIYAVVPVANTAFA